MKSKVNKLRSAIKEKDGWWASIFAGPLANRLLEPICDLPWLTPNHLTIISFFIGLVAAWFFAKGDHASLVIAAVLVQLSFVVDCMDGQFARYSKKFSDFGAWLDRISDRLKDFAYFFTIAWGFHAQHPEVFNYSFAPLMNFLGRFLPQEKFFQINTNWHILTMKGSEFESWIVFPIAMLAMFSVFLIDYYVNQDMKFPTKQKSESKKESKPSFIVLVLKSFMSFGLDVYRSIPILRFNIGEQALLITIFALLGASFTLLCFFALLGSFYIFYWPLAKYLGFTEAK